MMMKKWIAASLAAVLALGVAGCGGSKAPETPAAGGNTPAAPAKKPVKVTIWSNATEGEQGAFKTHAEAWAKQTGNTVEIVNIQTGFQEAAAAIAAGQGPDIHYGIIHDNLGTYYKAGFLEPVPAGIINTADYEKMTVDGVSYDGKLYAVPIAYESIGLMYNKKLIADAPKTWDEFVKAAKEKGFQYDIKNFYFSYGFIGGSGGYVFKNTGGGLDAKDVGLGNDGAKAGFKLLNELVHTHKLMPVDVSYDMAKGNFIAGKQALYLSGPWDIADIKAAGIDLGVAPMPTLPNGKPFTPFVGVLAGYVSSASKVKAESWELMKYLQENAGLDIYKAGGRTPALKKLQETADFKSNPLSPGFAASGRNGVPMPNIPAMAAVWTPAGDALSLVVEGKAAADKAAADATKAINEAVATMK